MAKAKTASTGSDKTSTGKLNDIQAESAAAIFVLADRIAEPVLAKQIKAHAKAILRGSSPVLAIVSAYSLPDGSTVRKMRDQWIIERDSGAWLVTNGSGWEFPPLPSSRDSEFYACVSFATPEDAMTCWQRLSKQEVA